MCVTLNDSDNQLQVKIAEYFYSFNIDALYRRL